MKKILLVMVAVLCVASVSAQSKVKDAVNYVASQKWSVGLRVGSGAQVDAECFYSDKAYLEGRLGFGFVNGYVDFAASHNWNCCAWDWTPSAGQWYLDAGVGASVAGGAKSFGLGIVGQAKFGIKFNKVPIRLAIDLSPAFGYHRVYATTTETTTTDENGASVTVKTRVPGSGGFWGSGLLNGGLSATWCF